MSEGSAPGDSRTNLVSRLKQLWRKRQKAAEEAAVVEAAVAQAGPPGAPPREMLLKAAQFDTLRVSDVMAPRADIIAIEAGATLDDVIERFAETGVSRMPVFRETLDDPVGLLHVKDVVAEIARQRREGKPGGPDRAVGKLRRDILFVPPSMKLSQLLLRMQSTRQHLALVVDEYGGTDGLVSIEDLVEQIVGNIEDEHDDDAPLIVERGAGVWEADAKASIEDLEQTAGVSLDLSDRDEEADVDTLGGLVFTMVGRVPARGEIVRHPVGMEFEVLDADPRRIKRLRARRSTSNPSSEAGA